MLARSIARVGSAFVVVLCCAGREVAGQPGGHRDWVHAGFVPVAITFPPDFAANVADVELVDNGHVVPSVAAGDALPVALAILVDLNGDRWTSWSTVTESVVKALPRFSVEGPPALTFNMRPRSALGTGGLDELRLFPPPEGPWFLSHRSFWNAADWSLARLSFRRSRRVMLIVTDGSGRDYPAGATLADGLEDRVSRSDFASSVLRGHVLLYVRSFTGAKLQNGLAVAAHESGGDTRMISRVEEFPGELQRLASELADQAMLYFRPALADGRVGSLEVRAKGSLQSVRARRSYVAEPRR